MRIRISVWLTAILMLGIFAGAGTYAWFTAQIRSSNNAIRVGTLEIGAVTEIPQPLFCSSPRYEGDPYAIGEWYPGRLLFDQDRTLTIENIGTLPLKVYGISANMKNFNNPLNKLNAEEEFTNNLIITAKIRGQTYYEGSLKDLIQATRELKYDNSFINLYTDGPQDRKRVDINFNVMMSPSAGNNAQGVTATVDLIIHATQLAGPTQ